MQIATSIRSGEGLTCVRLDGEADLSCTAQLDKILRLAFSSPLTKAVMVDLDRLSFIDCSTVGVLMRARRRAQRQGVGFTICHAHGIVGTVLELTGVPEALHCDISPDVLRQGT